MYVIGIKNGNAKGLTEFLKHTGQEAAKENGANRIDSLIQINNIYIDQRIIQNLPEDTKEQLEILLLKSAKVDKGLQISE